MASEIDRSVEPARRADEIYRDEVRRARAQDPVEKLLAGFRLFEQGLAMTRVDVIRQIGTSDPAAVEAALLARFARVRRVREAGLFQPCPASVKPDRR